MTSSVISAPLRRASVLFGSALLVAAAFTVAVPHDSYAGGGAKTVFQRTKPHMSYTPAPGRPQGPTSLKGQVPELADWYCGEGAGPGGHAVCTQDLIDSCSGTYVPPKTNGEHQTWGMCHESTG
jgi:hypothetical protein